MNEAERKRLAGRLMALRAKPVVKDPEPAHKRMEKNSKSSPKRTRNCRERTPHQKAAGLECIHSRTDLRIVYDAATAAGHAVEPVMDSKRKFAKSRLLIDGELCEVHYVTKAIVRSTTFGRSSYSRGSVIGTMAHIVLIDIVDHGVLKIYKFPSEYLKRRLFGAPGRQKAELNIPLDTDGYFGDYRLQWTLERAPPPEA